MYKFNQLPSEKVEDEVFSELYNEYYPKIFKYTLYRVGNPNIAEDLTSEIFEKLWINYHTYNPKIAKFSTWLFTIANNTIINYYKKNHHQSLTINLEIAEGKYQLEDIIFEQELKERLILAIMGLDERQRHIIALKFAAGQTNREIGSMLNLSESNVGTILYRSLKSLRELLKEAENI